ncbi:hypothetical protein FACS18949_13200 [Clostridia bacterium]|nr:hypothetical protein FACS18949_13200 [Clostridia bacterium]
MLGFACNRAQNYHADSEGSHVAYEAMAQATVAFREKAAMPEDWNANIRLRKKPPCVAAK